jgi:ATP-dependent DNA ligase
MDALPVKEIPSGAGWQYEPKWDGFRCIAFRDGEKIELQSKSGRTASSGAFAMRQKESYDQLD